ncbi:MAG TPA: hypothetical protein VKA60_25690 [Blastocatellia bacterium]|nr:hypothetical protein [Blastocatellia bacterium]
MMEEGPQLESLTRRLAECPADFMAAPRDRGGKGEVYVAAVVFDLLRELGGAPDVAQLDVFEFKRGDARRERLLRVVLIAAWLLYDPWFRSRHRFAAQAYEFLALGLDDVAAIVPSQSFASDADRREELARLCLRALGLRPAGESDSQAEDRLTTLDSVERGRVIREARAAEARARQIREEMARKAAEEAAAVYGRE